MQRFGAKFDHALLAIRWAWRLRVARQKPKPDFANMTLEDRCKFNEVLRSKLVEGAKSVCIDEADAMGRHYTFLSECVRQTIDEVVPPVKLIMSDKTKELYQQCIRDYNAGRKVTKSDRVT